MVYFFELLGIEAKTEFYPTKMYAYQTPREATSVGAWNFNCLFINLAATKHGALWLWAVSALNYLLLDGGADGNNLSRFGPVIQFNLWKRSRAQRCVATNAHQRPKHTHIQLVRAQTLQRVAQRVQPATRWMVECDKKPNCFHYVMYCHTMICKTVRRYFAMMDDAWLGQSEFAADATSSLVRTQTSSIGVNCREQNKFFFSIVWLYYTGVRMRIPTFIDLSQLITAYILVT